jgi:hypothetical protein
MTVCCYALGTLAIRNLLPLSTVAAGGAVRRKGRGFQSTGHPTLL